MAVDGVWEKRSRHSTRINNQREKAERTTPVARWGGRQRTTTSIIILPFAPANPLPPSVYASCAITVLFDSNRA